MWKLTLFTAFFLPLLLWLGNWQLDRAAYKQDLEETYLSRLSALPIQPDAALLAAADNDFVRVRLTGNFHSGQDFLIDNQVQEGAVGYWVVTPFTDTANQTWLLNRGWIGGTRERAELPTVPALHEQVTVEGVLWPFTGLVPLLEAEADLDSSSPWPRRVQRLDTTNMAAQLGESIGEVIPQEIRLEASSPGVLTAAPAVLVGADHRHRGYASTWFGLALVLTCGYLIFWWRHRKQQQESLNG